MAAPPRQDECVLPSHLAGGVGTTYLASPRASVLRGVAHRTQGFLLALFGHEESRRLEVDDRCVVVHQGSPRTSSATTSDVAADVAPPAPTPWAAPTPPARDSAASAASARPRSAAPSR